MKGKPYSVFHWRISRDRFRGRQGEGGPCSVSEWMIRSLSDSDTSSRSFSEWEADICRGSISEKAEIANTKLFPGVRSEEKRKEKTAAGPQEVQHTALRRGQTDACIFKFTQSCQDIKNSRGESSCFFRQENAYECRKAIHCTRKKLTVDGCISEKDAVICFFSVILRRRCICQRHETCLAACPERSRSSGKSAEAYRTISS